MENISIYPPKKFTKFLILTFLHIYTPKNFTKFLKSTFLLYNIYMSKHEVFIQYIKIILGITTFIVILSFCERVLKLLTIISQK